MTQTGKFTVLVSGPLPPPLGGMETYCLDYLKTTIPNSFNIIFCRCVLLHKLHDTNGFCSLFLRVLNRILTLIVWLWNLFINRPDLVHVHSNSGYGFYARGIMVKCAKLCGSKSILHMHGASFKEFYQKSSIKQKKRIICILCKPNVLIVLSMEWKRFFESIGVPSENIHVHINSVFLPIVYERTYKTDKLVVLYLSRIEQRKGVNEIIDVINSYPCLGDMYKFVIAGPKSHEYDKIYRKVHDYNLQNIVDMPGPLVGHEKEIAYRTADVYLLQSYAEGLPIGLLEAMSYGIPCVTTPVGGIPDLVSHMKNGILIQPGDKEALKDALITLASDTKLRKNIGNQARITIEECCSWHSGETKMIDLYHNIINT